MLLFFRTPQLFGAPTPKSWCETVRQYRDIAQPAIIKLNKRFAAAAPPNSLPRYSSIIEVTSFGASDNYEKG